MLARSRETRNRLDRGSTGVSGIAAYEIDSRRFLGLSRGLRMPEDETGVRQDQTMENSAKQRNCNFIDGNARKITEESSELRRIIGDPRTSTIISRYYYPVDGPGMFVRDVQYECASKSMDIQTYLAT